jgi:hypothetical protein
MAEVEHRLRAALEVLQGPWIAQLETRGGLGGESFIQSAVPDRDDEMYLRVDLAGELLRSPDARLDALFDFVGHAPQDVEWLLERLRSTTELDA